MRALTFILTLLLPGLVLGDEQMPPPAWRSKYGYQDLRWGMSRADVQKKYPKLIPREGEWESDGHLVAGYRSNIRFVFSDDRLREVKVYSLCQTDDECLFRKSKLKVALNSKYGPSDNEIGRNTVWWIDGTKPEPYRDAKMIISVAMVPLDERGPPFTMISYLSLEIPYRPNTEGL